MGRFKRLAFTLLTVHALVDLTLAVLMYRRVGVLAPSLAVAALCLVFSFYLFPALRDEEFSRRWFPGKWGRGPIDEPAAFRVTFAALVLIHLILTGLWVRLVY